MWKGFRCDGSTGLLRERSTGLTPRSRTNADPGRAGIACHAFRMHAVNLRGGEMEGKVLIFDGLR